MRLEDRIVHKCLCDNFLYREISKRLIYDSGAVIKGKGLSFTDKRLITHIEKLRRISKERFVLKIDIKQYFKSIDREILYLKLKKIIKDERLFYFTKYLIETSNKEGLSLGSQISQLCATFYLSDLDHYIKEKLECKYYGRYMDDMYILSSNKQELKKILNCIEKELNKTHLYLNKEKTYIRNLNKGFIFCKTKYTLYNNNRIVKIPYNNFISRYRRKLKYVNREELNTSLRGYLKRFNHKTRKKYLKLIFTS